MRSLFALVLCGAVGGSLGSSLAPRPSDAAEPTMTADACLWSCRDCQHGCTSLACEKACTASAAGCCAAFGRRPPAPTLCGCQ